MISAVWFRPRSDLDSKTTINIDGRTFEVAADDLEVIAPLGRGAYGVVEKMRHRPSDTELAVKVTTLVFCLLVRCAEVSDHMHRRDKPWANVSLCKKAAIIRTSKLVLVGHCEDLRILSEQRMTAECYCHAILFRIEVAS